MDNTKFALKTLIYHWGEENIKGFVHFKRNRDCIHKQNVTTYLSHLWDIKNLKLTFLKLFTGISESDWWEGAGVTKLVQNKENVREKLTTFY